MGDRSRIDKCGDFELGLRDGARVAHHDRRTGEETRGPGHGG